MKKYLCIESVLDVPYRGKRIRIWIDQSKIQEDYLNDSKFLHRVKNFLKKKRTDEEIVDFIDKPQEDVFINSVEITKEGMHRGIIAHLSAKY